MPWLENHYHQGKIRREIRWGLCGSGKGPGSGHYHQHAIRSGQVGRADMIGGAPVDTEDLMKVVVLEVVEH